MAQQEILDIFEDCINRLNRGQSMDDCLRVYPQYASRLRLLLEVADSVRVARIPATEILEDQETVWQSIQYELPNHIIRPLRPSFNIRLQRMVAVVLLLLLVLGAWFILTRPDLSDTQNFLAPIEVSITSRPTITDTIVPSPTAESSATDTPQATETATSTIAPTDEMAPTETPTSSPTRTSTSTSTPSLTSTPSPTNTLTVTSKAINMAEPTRDPSNTPIPTLTFAPGCGAPLTIEEVVNQVLEIYPNTTITVAKQVTRFGGTLVWEIETSHGIRITIDVACGYILTIEYLDNDLATETATSENTQITDATSQPNGDGAINSASIDDNDGDGNHGSEDDSGDGDKDDNSDDNGDNDEDDNED